MFSRDFRSGTKGGGRRPERRAEGGGGSGAEVALMLAEIGTVLPIFTPNAIICKKKSFS